MFTNTKISVYRNLNKGCISFKKDGRVSHTSAIALIDVEFYVNENGRQKVIEQKRKNVHAFVKGFIAPSYGNKHQFPKFKLPVGLEGLEEVTYNPYKAPYFYLRVSQSPVYKAEYALVTDSGVYAYLPR